jgi:NADH:ubiquinone reductase (H+-translocating)
VSAPHIVVIGGGFGGLAAARALAHAPVRITLIDRRNHHLFQPLLYQVATAALNASDIARPIRRILRRQANCEVILGEVESIDRFARKVILGEGEIAYDYLIVASGATHSYFSHDTWERDAPGLKTIEDALEIRRRVLVAYEAAEREPDPEIVREWMTFVIVGGGPTGAELAGALAEISRRVLARDFRRIDPKRARIILVEGTSRLLAALTPESSTSAQRQLKHLGVEVMTSTMVTGIDDRGVMHVGGRIPTRTVIWAAGVAASPLGQSLGVPLDRAGRVIVKPDLSIPGTPEVFVIGDLALILRSDGRPVPGLAPAAMQEGRHAARNVMRAVRGQPPNPFRYIDKGMLATIGRGAAVAEIGRLRLSGFIAWTAWLFIHIFYLIGFRNRFMVLAGWAFVYLRNESGARLITGDVEPLLERGESGHDKQRMILS